jgi:predicted GIY-YIG superfamily endonuclease
VVLYTEAYKTRGAAMSGEAAMKKRLRQDAQFRQKLLDGAPSRSHTGPQ